ncbi:prolipoprotein diacylglyceryl transferase family protein, partial [Bacillus cereus]|uniref:prolipoprotein diacylglyceryl transferase family protein n=1 Tax=Bacillus cereus TaxID=1396 RepID=UPI0021129E9B
YGVIIGRGAILGVILATREGKNRRISSDGFYDLIFLALPISNISARIYYVIFEWNNYKENPVEIFAIWHGGNAIHGGIIG